MHWLFERAVSGSITVLLTDVYMCICASKILKMFEKDESQGTNIT